MKDIRKKNAKSLVIQNKSITFAPEFKKNKEF